MSKNIQVQQKYSGIPKSFGRPVIISDSTKAGNALARVQRVHAPADLWDITFCTR
jgi:hypothetical protein